MTTATAPSFGPNSVGDTVTDDTVTDDAVEQRAPRSTAVTTVVVGAVLALVAVALTVLMWLYAFGVFGSQPGIGGSEGPGSRPWHYWVSLFLASAVPLVLAAVGFGYYWLLVRPRLRAR